MSKFKEGQKYRKVSGPVVIDGPKIGDEVTIKRTYSDYIVVEEFDSCTYDIKYFTDHFEPAEDRTTWHPHHDVIVAWAKGAKVQYDTLRGGGWSDWESSDKAPGFQREHKYRVKPVPDHTAEIAEIEQQMRKLSEAQKELADRLEKLK